MKKIFLLLPLLAGAFLPVCKAVGETEDNGVDPVVVSRIDPDSIVGYDMDGDDFFKYRIGGDTIDVYAEMGWSMNELYEWKQDESRPDGWFIYRHKKTYFVEHLDY